MTDYVLHGRPGWGSAIVEAQLAWYGLPFRFVDSGDLLASAQAQERLRPLNPLSQVPVLELPDGQVMSESAAITLHLADLTGRDDLVPGRANASAQPSCAGWCSSSPTSIRPSPTATCRSASSRPRARRRPSAARSTPTRAGCGASSRRRPARRAFLGERFSALDIYLAVMTRWRPGRSWFAEHAPRVLAAAQGASSVPALAPVFERNFPCGVLSADGAPAARPARPRRAARVTGGTGSATAGDVDEGAGRVRRLVRQQPQDRPRHLLGGAAPPHRHRGLDAVDPPGSPPLAWISV